MFGIELKVCHDSGNRHRGDIGHTVPTVPLDLAGLPNLQMTAKFAFRKLQHVQKAPKGNHCQLGKVITQKKGRVEKGLPAEMQQRFHRKIADQFREKEKGSQEKEAHLEK